MESVGRADPAHRYPGFVEALAECPDLVLGPGDHAVAGIVDRGQLHPVAEVLRNVIGAHSHRDHGAGG